jgi:hypothetical protein
MTVTMDTPTRDLETGPGWRELLEALYEELEAARTREQAARERERFLERLVAEAHRELQRWRGGGPTPPRDRPASAPPPRERSSLHTQILEALASQPAGLTRAQVEAAVGTGRPLGHVLDGLARRGHVRRLGKGVFALPHRPPPTDTPADPATPPRPLGHGHHRGGPP